MQEFKTIDEYIDTFPSVQFPIDQPLPFPLIRRIVEYRVKENLERMPKRKNTNTGRKKQKGETV